MVWKRSNTTILDVMKKDHQTDEMKHQGESKLQQRWQITKWRNDGRWRKRWDREEDHAKNG